MTGAGAPEHVRVLDVTDGTLPLLGVRPILGRLFTRQDDSPGAAQTAVLNVLILAETVRWSIICYRQLDYGRWHPKGNHRSSSSTLSISSIKRTHRWSFQCSGSWCDHNLRKFRGGTPEPRLKPGISLQEATTDLERLLPVVIRTFPPPAGVSANFFQSMHLKPSLIPLKEELVGNVQNVLWVLFVSVILVLLVACANVANLLIVRIEGRHHEFAIRHAIGAAGKGFPLTFSWKAPCLGL